MTRAILNTLCLLIHLLHTNTPLRLALLVIALYKEQIAHGHTTNKSWSSTRLCYIASPHF